MAVEKDNLKGDVFDFLKDLLIIIAIVLFLRTFIAMPFQINWQSMYESYYDREFIIVDRLSYYFWEPKRWDVIVFKPHVSETKEFFLKRVIWVPWDTLKIEDWKVYLKEKWQKEYKELKEPYLNEENSWFTFVWSSRAKQEYTLGDWDYFAMWDNRNHSTDSRTCFSNCTIVSYFIHKEAIIWKVFLDLWYFNFKTFSFLHPEYGIDTYPKFFKSFSHYDYK